MTFHQPNWFLLNGLIFPPKTEPVKKTAVFILAFILFLPLTTHADSPDFSKAYMDIPMVKKVAEDGLMSPEIAKFISSKKTPLDIRAATINALSWNSDDADNAEIYSKLLYKKSLADLNTATLNGDELFNLGFLIFMDDYFHPENAIPYLEGAQKKIKSSFTVSVILGIARAQIALDSCNAWKEAKKVLENKNLIQDLRPAAKEVIVDYMSVHEGDCDVNSSEEAEPDIAPPPAPAPPAEQTETAQGPQLEVSDIVRDTWKAVAFQITDKSKNSSAEYVVWIGDVFEIPDSGLKITVVAFVPDFKLEGATIISVSNEPHNPAAEILVYENETEIFKGWLYAKFPQIHPFQHERYGIILMRGIAQEAEAEINSLKNILKEDPKNLKALVKLGDISMDLGIYNAAINAYNKALEIEPENVNVRVDIGSCYRYSGNIEMAMQEYDKALAINPDHALAHRNKATILAYELEKYPEAADLLEKYLKRSPGDPDKSKIEEEIKQLREKETAPSPAPPPAEPGNEQDFDVSSPPTGSWQGIEESPDSPEKMAFVLIIDEYSTAADVKALSESASQSKCAAKIDSFEPHGTLILGQLNKDETEITGQFWAPQFVTARLSGDTWKITMVSGSPFMEQNETEPGVVGLIELNLPVRGEGAGTARLYRATQVVCDNGEVFPNASISESKVYKIKLYTPPEITATEIPELIRPLPELPTL